MFKNIFWTENFLKRSILCSSSNPDVFEQLAIAEAISSHTQTSESAADVDDVPDESTLIARPGKAAVVRNNSLIREKLEWLDK